MNPILIPNDQTGNVAARERRQRSRRPALRALLRPRIRNADGNHELVNEVNDRMEGYRQDVLWGCSRCGERGGSVHRERKRNAHAQNRGCFDSRKTVAKNRRKTVRE